MKIWNPILMTLFFFCSTLSAAVESQKSSGLAEEVRSAGKLILSGSPTTQDVHKSLMTLIDAVCKIADQDTGLPAGFLAKMQEASRAFSQNRLGTESEAALKAAYKVLYGGKEFAFPEGVRAIGEIRRIAGDYIDRSTREIENNQSDGAARDLLSFILLVVTPVMR
jgi:hypothetical protein